MKKGLIVVLIFVSGLSIGWISRDLTFLRKSELIDPKTLDEWKISKSDEIKGFTHKGYGYSMGILPFYRVTSGQFATSEDVATVITIRGGKDVSQKKDDLAISIENTSKNYPEDESLQNVKTLEEFDNWYKDRAISLVTENSRDKIVISDGETIDFNGVSAIRSTYKENFTEEINTVWINFLYNGDYYHLVYYQDNDDAKIMTYSLYFQNDQDAYRQ